MVLSCAARGESDLPGERVAARGGSELPGERVNCPGEVALTGLRTNRAYFRFYRKKEASDNENNGILL